MSEKVYDAVLWCPNCFEQHIDKPEPDMCECGHNRWYHRNGQMYHRQGCDCQEFTIAWDNPPHRSHKCHYCNHVWRPSDAFTNGVYELQTKGKADGFAQPRAFATKKEL